MAEKRRTGFIATDVVADILPARAGRQRIEIVNNSTDKVLYFAIGEDAEADLQFLLVGPGRTYEDTLPSQARVSVICASGESVTGCIIETFR